MDIAIIRIITFVFLSIFLLFALYCIYKGDRKVQYTLYLLFYLFFVFPLFLQTAFHYEYLGFWKANDALNDFWANLLYCIFLIFFTLFLFHSANKNDNEINDCETLTDKSLIIKVSYWIIIISYLLIILENGPGIIFDSYGARLSDDSSYHINENLITCSMLSYVVILLNNHKNEYGKFALSSLIILSMLWIHGKRFILAQFLILILFMFILTKKISGRKFIYLCAFSSIFIIGFSFLYGFLFKQNTTSLLDYISIDLSRHYTLIYQFYSSINNIKISVSPFDAILSLLFVFIPRSLWINKPFPFSNSITRSLIGFQPENINAGWSTTISLFSDLFDSFSYLGLLIGIILFVFLCEKINESNKVGYKLLLVYFSINFLTVQLVASIINILIMSLIYFFVYKIENERTSYITIVGEKNDFI